MSEIILSTECIWDIDSVAETVDPMVEDLLLLVDVCSPFDDPGLFEILSSNPLFRRIYEQW